MKETENFTDVKYNRTLVFRAGCFGMLLFGVGIITLGAITPDLQVKFSIDTKTAGTLFSILPFGILGGSLVFGPVCDRYGYKNLMTIACIGIAIGFECIAFANSLLLLKISIFFFGFTSGIINGAANALISDVSKGKEAASLSVLGVYFGMGALGMPFVLGLFEGQVSSFTVVAAVGVLAFIIAVYFMTISFPPAKTPAIIGAKKQRGLFSNPFLYFIAGYLLFQGATESIVNNWTTSYLIGYAGIKEAIALYALSVYLAGLIVMRLLIASVLRNTALWKLMAASLFILGGGIFLLFTAGSLFVIFIALACVGFGLAAGFPVMLGMAGNRFASRSGTAFSFIFTVALLGNMVLNYVMGILATKFGIRHYTSMMGALLLCMIVFCLIVFRAGKSASNESG